MSKKSDFMEDYLKILRIGQSAQFCNSVKDAFLQQGGDESYHSFSVKIRIYNFMRNHNLIPDELRKTPPYVCYIISHKYFRKAPPTDLMSELRAGMSVRKAQSYIKGGGGIKC